MMGHDPDGVVGHQLNRSLARRAWSFASPYKGKITAFLVVVVSAALLQLVPPILFGRIIDEGVDNRDRGLVTTLSIIVVVAAIADAGLSLLERWLSSRVGEGLIHDLRVALYDHVQRMPISFFTHTQTGTLVSRLNNDVVGAQRAVTGTLGQVVSNVIVVASTLVTMAFIEWRLTLLSLVLLPLFVVPAKRVGRVQQRLTRAQMDENAAMNSIMTERFGVSGAQLVKLFGDPDVEVGEFSQRASKVRDLGVRTALYGRTFVLALGLVSSIATALVYWIGGQLVISGSLAVGTLVTFALLVGRIYRPLTSLTSARVDVMTAFVSFERVFEVLDMPRVIDDHPGAVDLVDPRGAVRFEDVVFAYPPAASAAGSLGYPGAGAGDSTPVLSDIDLDVAAGTMVAIVGPSGAGKTTLASLVPRLYDTSAGTVSVDGHDVKGLTQTSLRSAVGVVTQDPHLFHDTVASNLRYANPRASDADLVTACRSARIHEVIDSLPNGYETVVGERGYRLSGGEKQRLAIARTLLKDPAIVILDEATSHLDAENETLIQAALETALVGRTSLVIAHRLSTVRSADEIIVVDDGRIVERGTHDQLVAQQGLYCELYATLERGQVRLVP
ncbi:MAG: ABC transporter ATP-binding protein [Actinomycetia bacterium]|nr:ABC transporter ATP-binding protein [Actinomycetes bacterium]